MPDPKDNARQTGDSRPPELDDEAPAAGEEDSEIEGTPGRGENQAGFLKDRDASGAGRNADKDEDKDKG